MKYSILGFIVIFFSTCSDHKKSSIEMLEFHSAVFNNERSLRVYLPNNYDAEASFKVLYLNDGQHLFRSQNYDHQDYWRVDEVTDSLIGNELIEPLIIVGIDNVGMSHRGNEYLPWEDIYLEPPMPNPQGKKYPDFLVNEVMPFIESRFKIRKGRENTGLGGFSYGGLISVYAFTPFPYDGDAIASIFRIEAEHLFQLITKDELSEIELTKGRQIFRHIFNVQQTIFRDSLDVKYKQWMEWNEGVARYTEIQLATLAADTNTYSPTKVFIELFPESNYTDTWKSKYGSNPTINPIRFVGEGVKGRVMFYFLGMGKAFLLDKIFPDWKQHYFEQTLDEMVILH